MESQDYAACNFKLNEQLIKFRSAKTTPTKTGQFVTLWKRNKKGITQPYDISDEPDLYLISVNQRNHSGLFIFPKTVLQQQKILSAENNSGKRGFRVYPIWSNTTNKQAAKTQLWQSAFFIEIIQNKKINCDKVKALFIVHN